MTLSEYLAADGHGALTRLHAAISKQPGAKPVAYSTLHAIVHGRTPRLDTARRIDRATGGEVSAAELLGFPREEKSKGKPASRKRRAA